LVIEEATSAAEQTKNAAKSAHEENERLKTALRTADRNRALAEQRLEHAESAADRAANRYRQAHQAAEQHAAAYLPVSDTIDSGWLDAEQWQVDAGLHEAEARAQLLDVAERSGDGALASLDTLRGERTGTCRHLAMN
jgi:hypothetical protein